MDKAEEEYLDLEYNVLIVDANSQRSDSLKYVLDGLYWTDIVRDIDQAIDYISNTKIPNIIVSGSHFVNDDKTLGGIELCQYITKHKDDSINAIPIIVLMDNNDANLKAKLFNSGATDVLPPGYDILDLVYRIEKYIEDTSEKRKFQELLNEQKIRNKKSANFRTQLFIKHKESISIYEKQISKLREDIAKKEVELQDSKLYIQNLEQEKEQLLDEIKRLKTNQSNSENGNKSFTNLSEEDLEIVNSLVQHINQEHLFEENIIEKIANKILENEIDFRRVDNFYFIKNGLNILRKYIKTELTDLYMENTKDEEQQRELCIKYLDNLVETIIKLYLNKFLLLFSTNLLEAIGTKDKNAIKFLKFYDGRVEISSDGTRYKKPLICDDQNNPINMVSIMQIVNQRTRAKDILLKEREKMSQLDKELENIIRTFNVLVSSENTLSASDKLQENMPFEEKLDIAEDILISQKNSLNPLESSSRMEEIEEKLQQLINLRENYEKKIFEKILQTDFIPQTNGGEIPENCTICC